MNKFIIIYLLILPLKICSKLELDKSDLINGTQAPIKILLAINTPENSAMHKPGAYTDVKTYNTASTDQLVHRSNDKLQTCCEIIEKAIERTNQFQVILKSCDSPKNKKDILSFFELGYNMIIFLNEVDNNKAYEWRLYDTTEAIMVKGKKIYKRGELLRGHAYAISDDIWLELTNTPNSFSSKIAYVKCKKNRIGRQQYVVCICDYDGSNEQEIISNPGIYVGLHWLPDPNNLCLFCSEFTRRNARFISINSHKTKRVIFNFEGTCVGISLSNDSNKAVYCRSGDIWLYQFDQATKQGKHIQLIKNNGKNISPTQLENGDIIFCSDAPSILKNHTKSKGPQICYFTYKDKSIKLLTKDGYCVGPAYCKVNNKIAYCKRIKGLMQLFIYDLNTNTDQQITFDGGNKTDCSFSPCGNNILFCYQNSGNSQIISLNIATNKRFLISKATDLCYWPAWSNNFITFPSI